MSLKHIKSDAEFKELIIEGKSVVMIHRDNCPYCAKAEPWMEELSEKYTNIAAANKDDIPAIMGAFQVTMYPTFIALENGTITETFFGDTVEDKVKDFVNKHA
jgi:thioredoxin-like negative regulator of GroEL